MSTITERFVQLIEAKTTSNKRFKHLEETTNISALSWRKAFNGGQRPMPEMLEALANLWPENAFWLVSGITDPERGHIAPTPTKFPVIEGQEQEWATAEFRYILALAKAEPTDPSLVKARQTEITDAVFGLREKHIIPAVYVSYEKIMRTLGKTASPEFYLLEADSKLQVLRNKRYEAETKMRETVHTWRQNLTQTKAIDRILTSLLHPVLKGGTRKTISRNKSSGDKAQQ